MRRIAAICVLTIAACAPGDTTPVSTANRDSSDGGARMDTRPALDQDGFGNDDDAVPVVDTTETDGSSDAALPTDAGTDDTSPDVPDIITEDDCPPIFSDHATLELLPSGKTAPVTFQFPDNTAHLSLRVVPLDGLGDDICWQLEAVEAAGAPWVGVPSASSDYTLYCTDCVHRVALGRGFGRFDFPNDGLPLGPLESLTLTVAAWECNTRLPADVVSGTDLELNLPATVRVELDTRELVPPRTELRLPVTALSPPPWASTGRPCSRQPARYWPPQESSWC